MGKDNTDGELGPLSNTELFMHIRKTHYKNMQSKEKIQPGRIEKLKMQNKRFRRDLYTNILDKINPGNNPASIGTSAVATDHVNTPNLRTFLNQEKEKSGEHDQNITQSYMPQNKHDIIWWV